jgi:hypothetical protein
MTKLAPTLTFKQFIKQFPLNQETNHDIHSTRQGASAEAAGAGKPTQSFRDKHQYIVTAGRSTTDA